MAECGNIQRIGAYHDGELSSDVARELAEHLHRCAACQAELERLRALSKWLSDAALTVPDEALARLRRCVRPQRDRRLLRVVEALTATAAAILVVCSALLWQGRQNGVQSPRPNADWERAAIAPTGATPAVASTDADAGNDADVQLAQSILGDLTAGRGYGHE